MHNLRWSDLEYVLAVARSGSVAAAARTLNVNHTTVLRRVQAFEDEQNIRIFERLRSGYKLTGEGEVFLDAALAIEETVADLDRKVAGGDPALSGPLSITTTDSIFPWLAPDVAELQRRYPEFVVEVTVTNMRLDLDNRDADIAVRPSAQPPEHLIGRMICDLVFGIYATRARARAEADLPIEARTWLGVAPPLSGSVVGDWMTGAVPEERIVLRSNTFVGLRDMAVQWLGHTVLPRHLGDATAALVRVPDGFDRLAAGLWLLSHRDVLRSPRVRIASDFLLRALKRKQAEFEGE